MPRDWNAAEYDRLAAPMARWGAEVVGWLELEGDEHVMDAGCGTGRVTSMVLSRLPRGHTIALDGSSAMIELAKKKLVRFGDRVSFVVADLQQPLSIGEPVDAILSTATFHWVSDHDALFRNLAAVLKPGGQLCAQCGGAGNIAKVAAAASKAGLELSGKNFATAEDTRARLVAAGFTDVEVWLHEEPTPVAAADLEPYLDTICLGGLVENMDDDQRAAFVHDVASRLPKPEIDYVRLNIRARRSR